jgi:hypothetical protein
MLKQQKLEELHQARLAKEDAELRVKPEVNQRSLEILSSMDDGTRLPIYKRYQLVLTEKERKR